MDYFNLIPLCYYEYTAGKCKPLHKLLADNEVDSYDS